MVIAQEFFGRLDEFLQIQSHVLKVILANQKLRQVGLICRCSSHLEYFEFGIELVCWDDRFLFMLFDLLVEQGKYDLAVGALELVAICLMILADQPRKPIHDANTSMSQLLIAICETTCATYFCQPKGRIVVLVHLQSVEQRR